MDMANPVVPILSGFAIGLTKMMLGRNQNVGVQDFCMGLDFAQTPTGARLCQGSYIAVQVPEPEQWNWDNWMYEPSSGQVVSRDDHSTIPYNYLVFGVSKC
jgi:hypothetical protein